MDLRMIDPSQSAGRRFDAQLAALVQARDEGLLDGIGLSNISRLHLLRAIEQTEIVCGQNLFNLADQRLLDVLTDPRVSRVAARVGASPAQVAARPRAERSPDSGDSQPRPPGREPRRQAGLELVRRAGPPSRPRIRAHSRATKTSAASAGLARSRPVSSSSRRSR